MVANYLPPSTTPYRHWTPCRHWTSIVACLLIVGANYGRFVDTNINYDRFVDTNINYDGFVDTNINYDRFVDTNINYDRFVDTNITYDRFVDTNITYDRFVGTNKIRTYESILYSFFNIITYDIFVDTTELTVFCTCNQYQLFDLNMKWMWFEAPLVHI